jgi:hypothetical protein
MDLAKDAARVESLRAGFATAAAQAGADFQAIIDKAAGDDLDWMLARIDVRAVDPAANRAQDEAGSRDPRADHPRQTPGAAQRPTRRSATFAEAAVIHMEAPDADLLCGIPIPAQVRLHTVTQ